MRWEVDIGKGNRATVSRSQFAKLWLFRLVLFFLKTKFQPGVSLELVGRSGYGYKGPVSLCVNCLGTIGPVLFGCRSWNGRTNPADTAMV